MCVFFEDKVFADTLTCGYSIAPFGVKSRIALVQIGLSGGLCVMKHLTTDLNM